MAWTFDKYGPADTAWVDVADPDNPPAGAREVDADFLNRTEDALEKAAAESATYASKADPALIDTGWRQVINPGEIAALPGLEVFISRAGNEVSLIILETGSGGTTNAATKLLSLPVGFRPTYISPAPILSKKPVDSGAREITGAMVYCVVSGTSDLYLRPVLGQRHYADMKFRTTDAAPTILPGTPA